MFATTIKSILLASLILLPACGGDGNASSQETPDNEQEGVALMVTDAPTDDLSSFTATIEEYRLISASGAMSANLLTAPRAFDFLGLRDTQALAAIASPPEGSYIGVYIKLEANSLRARDRDGNIADVTYIDATHLEDTAYFTGNAMSFSAHVFRQTLADIDLRSSLTGGPPMGYSFDFHLTASHGDDWIGGSMKSFRGRITEIDDADDDDDHGRDDDIELEVRLYDPNSPDSHFGTVDVDISSTQTVIVDTNGNTLSRTTFLRTAQVGDLLEIQGEWSSILDDKLIAQSIQMETETAGQVELEGTITGIAVNAFDLLIEEIEHGSSTVYTTYGGEEFVPGVITVTWDDSTMTPGTDATLLTLTLGQEVDVRFADFANPLYAHAVEMSESDYEHGGDGHGGDGHDSRRVEGVIASVNGAGQTFDVTLDGDTHHNGDYAGQTITVSATGVLPEVDSGSHAYLSSINQLYAGLEVELSGSFSGLNYTATSILVEPAELEGLVLSLDLASKTIVLEGIVTDPGSSFGSTPLGDPLTVFMQPGYRIEFNDRLITIAELDALVTLNGPSAISLELEGIGDGTGSVLTWEIELEEDGE